MVSLVPRQKLQPTDGAGQLKIKGLGTVVPVLSTGEAMQNLAKGLDDVGDAAKKFQDSNNEAEAKRTETSFSAELREKMYGENGFFNLRGTAATSQRERIAEEVTKLREKYAAMTTTQDSQRMFDQASMARTEQTLTAIEKFASEQHLTASIESSSARIFNEKQDAIAFATTPGLSIEDMELGLMQKSHVIQSEILQMSELTYKDPEYAKMQMEREINDMYYRSMEAVIKTRGYTASREFLDKFGTMMSAEQRAQAEGLLKEGGALEEAQAFVDELVVTGHIDDYEKSMELIRQIEDPEIRKATVTEFTQEQGRRKASRKASYDNALTKMSQEIVKGKSMADVVAEYPEYLNLLMTEENGYGFRTLQNLAEVVAAGNEFALTSKGYLNHLAQMRANDPEAFLKTDPNDPLIKAQLTKDEYAKYINNYTEDKKRAEGYKTSDKIYADVYKVFTNKLSKKAAILQQDNKPLLDMMINDITAELSKLDVVTDADIQDAVNKAITPVTPTENGGFWQKMFTREMYAGKYKVKKRQGEISEEEHAYVDIENVPIEYRILLRQSFDRTGEPYTDTDVERAYGAFVTNDLEDLRKMGLNKNLKPLSYTKPNGAHMADVLFDMNKTFEENLKLRRDSLRFGQKIEEKRLPYGSGDILNQTSDWAKNMLRDRWQGIVDSLPLDERAANEVKVNASKWAAGDIVHANENIDVILDGIEHFKRSNPIVLAEGWKNKAYDSQEGGTDTIGVGHKLTAQEARTGTVTIDGEKVSISKGLSDEQVAKLFKQDYEKYQSVIASKLDVSQLNPKMEEALVSFAFNVGPTAFAKSTLLKLAQQGEWEAVIAQMRRWTKVTIDGKKQDSKGLMKRRELDAALLKLGLEEKNVT